MPTPFEEVQRRKNLRAQTPSGQIAQRRNTPVPETEPQKPEPQVNEIEESRKRFSFESED